MAVGGDVENGRRRRRSPIGAPAGLDGGREDGGNVGNGEGVVLVVVAAATAAERRRNRRAERRGSWGKSGVVAARQWPGWVVAARRLHGGAGRGSVDRRLYDISGNEHNGRRRLGFWKGEGVENGENILKW